MTGLLLTLWFSAAPGRWAAASPNLALNGDLSDGSGRLPAHWHPLRTPGSDSTLRWIAPHGGADGSGALEIDNPSGSASAWRQMLFLGPGWYHVGAEVRVENVAGAGAMVLLAHSNELAVMAPPLSGTTRWTRIGFFVREPRWGGTFAVSCSLGLERAHSSGRAWFRNIEVAPVDGPGTSGERVFDMSYLNRLSGVPEPDGIGSDQVAGAIVALLLAGLLAWMCVAAWRPGMGTPRHAIAVALVIAVMIAALQIAALAHFEGFYTDVQAKSNRAALTALHGPAGIYDPRLPADFYPPASIYPLWLAGALGRWLVPNTTVFRILVEAPPILANALVALTIFFVAAGTASAPRALALMLLFGLNPALTFDTVVWGQSDSLYALPMLLALALLMRGRFALGWTAEALAILVKPQALALTPVLGVLTLLRESPRRWLIDAVAFAGTITLAFIPFQIGHPPGWLLHVYRTLAERYPQASAGAFNLLALLGGWRIEDSTRALFGLTYFHFGALLTIGAFALSGWMIWRGRDRQRIELAAFVALFGFFLFAPRMHERYAYAALVFLVPLALDAPIFTAMYAALTASFLGNLVYNMLTNSDLAFRPRMDWFVLACIAVNLTVFAAAATRAVMRSPGRATAPG